MRKKRIIAKTLLLFLTVTGLLFFRPVYAEGSSITVTTDIKDLNQGQSLKLDLYKIGTISWVGYTTPTRYELSNINELYAPVFAKIFEDASYMDIGYDVDLQKMRNEAFDVDAAAIECAKKIMDAETAPTASYSLTIYPNTPTAATAVANGLYLGIARDNATTDRSDYLKKVTDGENERVVSYAYTEANEYWFKPYLVFVYNDGEREIPLDTINLKYEMVPYGDLLIKKELLSYAKSPVTFVFKVEIFEDQACTKPYKTRYESIDFSKPGKDSVMMTRIPMGYWCKVTEIHSGLIYKPVQGCENPQTVKIIPAKNGQIATVSFVNDWGENPPYWSYGIKNVFAHDGSGWVWQDPHPQNQEVHQ